MVPDALGITAIRQNCPEKAISNLKKGVTLADPDEDRWLFFRAMFFLIRAQFLRKGSAALLKQMKDMVDSIKMEDIGAGEVESLKEEEVVTEAYLTVGASLKEMGDRKAASEYAKKAQALIERYKLYCLKRKLKKLL
jgi:hypothetical protein